MNEHIEARRLEAKDHKGVWFDHRADKFVAEVYSRGERFFLGHFDTAQSAGDAYTKARADLPSGRAEDVETFASAFTAFVDAAAKDRAGRLVPNQTLLYREQEFLYKGTVFRNMFKMQRPFYEWEGACAECGLRYDTLTATQPKGITRFCEDHRRKGGARKAKAAPVSVHPPEWTSTARDVADELSLVRDTFDLALFFDECRKRLPDVPRAFNRFILEDPASPVEYSGGVLRVK
jgi:hypothetical protein